MWRTAVRGIGRREIGIARHPVVFGLAAEGIGVEGEIVLAASSSTPPSRPVVDARQRAAQLKAAHPRGSALAAEPLSRAGAQRAERSARQRLGDAVVGRADDAADRLRAVAQRRRPADHLDLAGRQRIDRHEVVFAEIGHAAAADAVVDDADAIDIEPANDRAAGRSGREARTGDAGLGEQEIAERRAGAALDLFPRHNGDGRKLIGDDGQNAGLGFSRCRRDGRRRRRRIVRRCRAALWGGTRRRSRRAVGVVTVTSIRGNAVCVLASLREARDVRNVQDNA